WRTCVKLSALALTTTARRPMVAMGVLAFRVGVRMMTQRSFVRPFERAFPKERDCVEGPRVRLDQPFFRPGKETESLQVGAFALLQGRPTVRVQDAEVLSAFLLEVLSRRVVPHQPPLSMLWHSFKVPPGERSRTGQLPNPLR